MRCIEWTLKYLLVLSLHYLINLTTNLKGNKKELLTWVDLILSARWQLGFETSCERVVSAFIEKQLFETI